MVKFSDGTPSPDEQPYVFITLKMLTVSFRILGTAAPLTSLSPAVAMHPINNVPIDAWILNTSGQPHHGDAYNDDPTSCQLCHGNPMMKSTSYSAITLTNGWCYRCHYGNGGDASGFVDPTK